MWLPCGATFVIRKKHKICLNDDWCWAEYCRLHQNFLHGQCMSLKIYQWSVTLQRFLKDRATCFSSKGQRLLFCQSYFMLYYVTKVWIGTSIARLHQYFLQLQCMSLKIDQWSLTLQSAKAMKSASSKGQRLIFCHSYATEVWIKTRVVVFNL